MAIQNNSFSPVTSVRFGAITLKDIWFNVNSMVLPTISLDPPQMNNRSGANVALAPDTTTYTDLTVDVILDKKWEVFDYVYSYFLQGINVENGKFSHYKTFELWAEIVDGEGNRVKKFNFHSCRLSEFTGFEMNPNDAEDTLQTMSLTFNVMYYTVEGLEHLYDEEQNLDPYNIYRSFNPDLSYRTE